MKYVTIFEKYWDIGIANKHWLHLTVAVTIVFRVLTAISNFAL